MVDLARINGIFDAIDTDKSGTIDAHELIMHLLGVGQEHESVSALFKVLDTDGDGLISREEFIAGFEKLRVAESSEVVLKAKLRLSDEEYAELKADFDEIDTDKSGAVDISEVRTLLAKERNKTAVTWTGDGQPAGHTASEHLNHTEAEVEKMMRSFDKDADGQITLAEYLAALGYTPPDQEAYDGLEAFEPTDQQADQEAAAAAPPVDAAAQLAASRLKSSTVLDENASVQEIAAQLGLQDDEINELKADFDEMDTDKSGSIDVAEAKASLTKERNGKAPTEEEVQAMMAQFDQNGDAKVTFAEYAAVLCA